MTLRECGIRNVERLTAYSNPKTGFEGLERSMGELLALSEGGFLAIRDKQDKAHRSSRAKMYLAYIEVVNEEQRSIAPSPMAKNEDCTNCTRQEKRRHD